MAKTKIPPFKNETYKDYSLPTERRAMESALAKATGQMDGKYPLVINGDEIITDAFITSHNPAHPAQTIGNFSHGTIQHAEQALQSAKQAFESWSKVSFEKRANYIFKAAKIAKRRRYEINAWMVLEVGKNWAEADADTAEAIDFLEYYGREMLRLGVSQPLVQLKGERDWLEYLPLGVGVVIPPWNFPFAILVGMSSAAIVAGNTVVLKPSSDSPMMGWLFVEIMEEAGLPKGVLNFVSAPGGEVGDYLVNSPITRFVSFTGSKQVGLHVTQNAAVARPGQRWIKRVVAEMGGKDSIVVAKDADLDSAADGIVVSAYGFQGQKCSACSRAIIEESVYPQMLQKIVERVKALEIGDPIENKRVGPVVSDRAFKKIQEYIEIGSKEGRIVAGGKTVGNEGYYIAPTVIADVAPNARIAQEEIFGPVLAVIPVKNFDEAIAVANNTEYGLTGAVYSKSRKNIEKAQREFFVGNLYVNRKCTGAMVGAHPFGGFNMSGTDSKAGGHDYLLLFMQAKSIAEKIIAAPKMAVPKKKSVAKKAVRKSRTK
ncbi:MAG TPA: L-glutamate gamma-semialdehyde dehydrogenase [Candidatus Kapabacteria bacterium]|nr:L-glutamate gamma-semialdehyde dehydrogenase [Candidatus Kapabacteria bacterium]